MSAPLIVPSPVMMETASPIHSRVHETATERFAERVLVTVSSAASAVTTGTTEMMSLPSPYLQREQHAGRAEPGEQPRASQGGEVGDHRGGDRADDVPEL